MGDWYEKYRASAWLDFYNHNDYRLIAGDMLMSKYISNIGQSTDLLISETKTNNKKLLLLKK
jgi:hypothetical protein